MDTPQLWLAKAREDFHAAEINEANDLISYAAALYQQSVEKALKAVLIKQGKGVPKTHDCFWLAKMCDAPEAIVRKADFITPYYFREKYPSMPSTKMTHADVQAVKKAAEEIILWTMQQS